MNQREVYDQGQIIKENSLDKGFKHSPWNQDELFEVTELYPDAPLVAKCENDSGPSNLTANASKNQEETIIKAISELSEAEKNLIIQHDLLSNYTKCDSYQCTAGGSSKAMNRIYNTEQNVRNNCDKLSHYKCSDTDCKNYSIEKRPKVYNNIHVDFANTEEENVLKAINELTDAEKNLIIQYLLMNENKECKSTLRTNHNICPRKSHYAQYDNSCVHVDSMVKCSSQECFEPTSSYPQYQRRQMQLAEKVHHEDYSSHSSFLSHSSFVPFPVLKNRSLCCIERIRTPDTFDGDFSTNHNFKIIKTPELTDHSTLNQSKRKLKSSLKSRVSPLTPPLTSHISKSIKTSKSQPESKTSSNRGFKKLMFNSSSNMKAERSFSDFDQTETHCYNSTSSEILSRLEHYSPISYTQRSVMSSDSFIGKENFIRGQLNKAKKPFGDLIDNDENNSRHFYQGMNLQNERIDQAQPGGIIDTGGSPITINVCSPQTKGFLTNPFKLPTGYDIQRSRLRNRQY